MSQKPLAKPAVQVLPYAWVILVVVYLASVAAPLNQFKVPPIIPVLMQELGIDLAHAGSLMSVIALVGLILALPAGILLQRFGPKASGLLALGFMVAGAVLGAQADSYTSLMASRVVEGVGHWADRRHRASHDRHVVPSGTPGRADGHLGHLGAGWQRADVQPGACAGRRLAAGRRCGGWGLAFALVTMLILRAIDAAAAWRRVSRGAETAQP